MDKELKLELEWINENLKAIVMNQNMICCQLKVLEDEMREQMDESHDTSV